MDKYYTQLLTMALINENSCPCVGSQLDLFRLPGTQTSQEKNVYVPHYPISSLNNDGPIEFDIKPSPMYTDLGDTRLYLRCKIVNSATGVDVANGTGATVCNMFLHAFIQRLEVYVGNTLISQSAGFYSWKSAIETLLNFGSDAKGSQLESIMYYKDNYAAASAQDNPGMQARLKVTNASKAFEVFGPLHEGLFFQDKYLLNNVGMRVKITRNPAAFYMLDSTAHGCHVEVMEAVLWVRRVQVSPSIELAHSRALMGGKNALYSIHRSEVEVMSVAAIQQTISKDNLFMSKLPNKLVIGLVGNTNFNGDRQRHPFFFQHFNVSNLEVSIDGENVCGTPMLMDFTDQKYMRAYHGLFHALNKSYCDSGLDITYEDFRKGYALFCFDLTADGCGNTSQHLELGRHGNLRFKMHLNQPLGETISVIIYGEFESVLEITNTREVLMDYKK